MIKRIIDFITALIIFVLSLPFMLLAILLIKLDSEGPSIYAHERVGKNGKKFTIYKLRTMIIETHDKNGRRLRDRERVTKVGKIIRKLSIDELPQLLNVMKGEMSFIGPRPLLVRYLPYYTDEEMHRHDVLPGITGLAQVKGRGFLIWEERIKYDVFYCKHISFKLDMFIIWLTIIEVLKSSGTDTIRPSILVDFDEHRKFKKLR